MVYMVWKWQKKAEGEFDQNIPNGTHFGWHENGSKKMQVKYTEGILNGEYIIWDDKGKILKDLLFKDGKCINCKEWFIKLYIWLM